jgi:hypothetical protein
MYNTFTSLWLADNRSVARQRIGKHVHVATNCCTRRFIWGPYRIKGNFIHSSMVLHPFVGPWPLLHFRNLLSKESRWQILPKPVNKNFPDTIYCMLIYIYNLNDQDLYVCSEERLCWLADWLTAKLLLALASTVIHCSASHGGHVHILLSDGYGCLQCNCNSAG